MALNLKKNREVRLNYGMITNDSLENIERLQRLIDEAGLVVAYHTVTAKRLKLVRVDGENLYGKQKPK